MSTQPLVYSGYDSNQIDIINSDGTISVPTDPGLGVEYDWNDIEQRQTGSTHVY